MQGPRSTRLHVGPLTLPIGGLIGFVVLLLRGPLFPLPSADPPAWARAVTAALYVVVGGWITWAIWKQPSGRLGCNCG